MDNNYNNKPINGEGLSEFANLFWSKIKNTYSTKQDTEDLIQDAKDSLICKYQEPLELKENSSDDSPKTVKLNYDENIFSLNNQHEIYINIISNDDIEEIMNNQ